MKRCYRQKPGAVKRVAGLLEMGMNLKIITVACMVLYLFTEWLETAVRPVGMGFARGVDAVNNVDRSRLGKAGLGYD
ncbi:MAG: hypothetical protein LUB83_04265 [Prevotellaceae bacterium]|nr:hypothetical protein [Prevotellaceae bacterium]